MVYPFTEEHEMIRDTVRAWAQNWYDGGQGVERLHQSGKHTDQEAWREITQELGMAGISIDEQYDGAGMGDLGRVIVMEELGAGLSAVPFFVAVGICADIIQHYASEKIKQQWLPDMAAGAVTAAYVNGLQSVKMNDNTLSGHVTHVLSGDAADVYLIAFQNAAQVLVGAVRRSAKGVTVTSQKTMDPTSGMIDLSLQDVEVELLIENISPEQLKASIDQSCIALAADSIGGAQKCLDITLEYAAQRSQFDRPIASFQAYKHKCADMFIELEAARSATYAAALASPKEKHEASLVARAVATDAYFNIAGNAIQLHGGIGFTWEYPLHFFFKRARLNRSIFGLPEQAYSDLSDMIIGDVA